MKWYGYMPINLESRILIDAFETTGRRPLAMKNGERWRVFMRKHSLLVSKKAVARTMPHAVNIVNFSEPFVRQCGGVWIRFKISILDTRSRDRTIQTG